MILGIGTDIIEISRIRESIQRTPHLIAKIFTKDENIYFEKKHYNPQTIAGRFAAKEAISKAFGTGFRNFTPLEIEVLADSLGKPQVILHEKAQELAKQLGVKVIHVTISHCKEYAVAYAIMEGGV